MLRSTKTLLVALSVCVGGVFFGLLGARGASQVYGMIAAPEGPTGVLLSVYLVQPGMGLFALGYLWLRKSPRHFFEFALSTLKMQAGCFWVRLRTGLSPRRSYGQSFK